METRRIVPKERGEQLGQQQGIPFLETSAKTNTNIDEAFESLARLILKKVLKFSLLLVIVLLFYVPFFSNRHRRKKCFQLILVNQLPRRKVAVD